MVRKFKETYCFTHNDISVWVKIDYYNNKISIVDPLNENYSKFQDKRWLFKERGVEYMQGWINILDVMKMAIEDAKKRYESQLAVTSKMENILVKERDKIINNLIIKTMKKK